MDTSTDSAIDLESISTKEEAKIINPINKDAVHRICSGQVVLSLATAVKELVENSLDSGATNIEIRLRDYGEELVEVLDNGSGVTEDNFAGLTLKYHTSKLRDFSDLLGVTTFGFRGEALSSLCALSNMTVVTRHNTAEIGTKLVFDKKGLIVSRVACARQPGTSVSLTNLFSTLPVRQKEFHRNIKREFNKMTQLLYAYCLVAEGVKIVCTNQVNNGQKSSVLTTQGGSVKDNIACIFGIKQAQSLMDLTPIYPETYVENLKENFFSNLENSKVESVDPNHEDKPLDVFSIKADHELELSEDSNETQDNLISSQKNGTQDSQSQNDTTETDTPLSSQYSTELSSQHKNDKRPFDFQGYVSSCAHGAGRSSKDRQFFYVNSRPCEPSKIIKLVNEVYKSYNPHQSPFIYLNLKMKRSSVDVNVTPDKRKLFFDKEKHLMEVVKASLCKLYENVSSTLKVENVKSDHSKTITSNNNTQIENQSRIFSSFLSQFSTNSKTSQSSSKSTTNDSKRKANSSLDNFIFKVSKISEDDRIDNDENLYEENEPVDNENLSDSEEIENIQTDPVIEDKSSTEVEGIEEPMIENKKDSDNCKEIVFLGFSDSVSLSQVVDISEVLNNDNCAKSLSPGKSKTKKESTNKKQNVSVVVDSEFEKVNTERKLVKINTTMDEIKRQMLESCRIEEENKEMLKKVKFRSEMNPVFNKECEEELKKELSKDMFSEMKIVGQFNLGFIITQLGSDLFIIDQHATDEKYNFETLQKTTVLTNQRLVIPQSLELTGVNERVLMDSLEVFRINGFTFQIDEDAPLTKRVKLVTIPISKGIVFGKEDIDELLFMLQDSPNELCRPSRLRAMFASRACRKSVMIGTALSKGDMRKLVDHMGVIEQPWNGENPICALAWSPNNKKLAVATTDRKVLLFDDAGIQRDKFSTKPSDPAAGKKSYSITCLMFSSQSDMIAVGQSDNIVFVYRVGEGWDSKKVICNKFPISSSCTCLLFISYTTLLCGQMDGKIRMLDCKTNKGTSAWNGSSACIAISSFSNGMVVSGHVDGALLTTGGRLLARHPVPPTAMCALDNAVLAAGCDRRIIIYDNTGRPISSFNLSRDSNQQEFTVACGSPSGQAAVVGSYDCCHLIEWSVEKRKWSLGRTIIIPGLYSVQGVAWSADGAKIAISGYTGATLLYEAMLRRWIYRGVVEAIRRGQGQVTLNRLAGGVQPYTVQANIGKDIHSIRILGDDWYAVCRTESSLIVCDLARSLSSEVQWSGSGEKFFFQHTPVCLVHRAGELTLIEYGIDSILASVRTEYTNPHLISVRINEGQNFSGKDNKKLAYLLDQKSVCIVDLVTGSQVAQCRLESRVDWLELSESAHVLLLRDRRRRLLMMDVSTGKMEVILSGVSFVQWVEGSDAVVAQTSTHLAVWYSIEEVGLVELVECGGGEAVRVEGTGNPLVVLQGGSLPMIPLDHARLHFCTSLRSGDFTGCESYLNTLSDAPQATMLWQQLAYKAMEIGDMKMAVRCWRALGDEAKSAYLARTLVFAEEYAKENIDTNGIEAPKVRARLAILSYDLKAAEQIYLEELKDPELAITMYRNLHRWPEAISVAERLGLSEAHSLREHYMNHLITTGGEAEAASILMNKGDSRSALQLLLKAGLAGHAARTLKDSPSLLTDRETVHSVLRALFKNECWEQAAELCESSGDQNQAVKLYAKANSYAKAIQRARLVAPNEVRDLEQAWGEWLMGRRQYGAAVAHLIEAGDSKGALVAAVKAQQWAKALQIIQVIDDVDSIQEYYHTLAAHYVSVQDWDTAEALWEAGGLVEEGARKLGEAGQGVRGLALARRLLGSQAAVNIFQPLADKYKEQGKYKEAELLFIGMGMSEAAMTMYEETGRHAALLRVVAEHRPALLAAATRRVAQQLHNTGRLKQAEQYYIQADDWKSAIQMYRAADQWEDAYRVSQNHASPQIQEQVLVAWSNWIEDPAAAARILQARGGVEAGVRWAARGGRWARALDLCKAGAPHLEAAVRAQMAAHLEDQGKLEEAEEEFIKGGGASEAVDMWIHAQQYARALALSEKHAPEKEQEVLREYAKWAEEQGDITLYEALIIRAGQPQEIIRHYKENGMWSDAIRVCEEYLPQAVRALKMEAARNGGLTDGGDMDDQESADPETILRTAAQHANNGEYLEAIQGLLSLSVEAVGSGTVERATLRAARLARDHLTGREAKQVAPLIAQRLSEAGQEEMGIRLQNALLNMHSDVDSQDYNNVSAESGSNRADQLAKRGEWAAAIETATAAGPAVATRIAVRWAATLLQHPDTLNYQNRDGSLIGGVCAAIHVLSHWANSTPGPPSSIAPPLLARASALNKAPFTVLRDLRNILHTILINCNGEAEGTVQRGVEAAALLCIREACRHAAPLKPLALRSATALLRHTDIIAADNAFYEAGMLLRESEREGEALVMLNRYLDLAEAADADSGDTTLDHADFGETDFPQEVVLGGNTLSAQEHDEVREWVLAVSLDQSVTQVLPVDKRGLYECCLGPGDAACVLTGYPLSTRLVNFTNGRSANRDAWAKIVLHCSTEPTSDAADCRRFLTAWCGADDYTLT